MTNLRNKTAHNIGFCNRLADGITMGLKAMLGFGPEPRTGADMQGKDEAWGICASLPITALIPHAQINAAYLR
ncbi:MAG TPA: hypothetical protein VK705_05100 [Ferruginibacter sp.]|nr:hypothetical protein [Ferruginibacter sp.]